MKKASSILLVVASAFVLNVQRPPVADRAIVTESKTTPEVTGKKLKVNPTASSLEWKGTKPSGTHTGTIKITEGSVSVKKGSLKGGNFVIDMTSIANTDLQGKGKEGLEGHLKSADFFDVTKFPAASFEITAVGSLTADQKPVLEGATHNISGNLTMKGITKNVTFPAIITASKKSLTATANFNIDRTEWGITYGADGKVAKEINLKLNLKAGE